MKAEREGEGEGGVGLGPGVAGVEKGGTEDEGKKQGERRVRGPYRS